MFIYQMHLERERERERERKRERDAGLKTQNNCRTVCTSAVSRCCTFGKSCSLASCTPHILVKNKY